MGSILHGHGARLSHDSRLVFAACGWLLERRHLSLLGSLSGIGLAHSSCHWRHIRENISDILARFVRQLDLCDMRMDLEKTVPSPRKK